MAASTKNRIIGPERTLEVRIKLQWEKEVHFLMTKRKEKMRRVL